MKRLLFPVLSTVLFTSPAFAIMGGPWDAGVPGNATKANPSSAAGTYQGTIKGKNISGIVMFGTGPTSAVSNTSTTSANYNWFTGAFTQSTTASLASGLGTSDSEGRCFVFVNGYSVYGQMSTVIDMMGRSITGVLEGSKSKGTQAFSLKQLTNQDLGGITNNVVTTNVGGTTSILNGVQVISGGTTTITDNSTTNNGTNTYDVTHYTFNNVININGTFDAKLSSYMANPSFKGTGTVQVTQPLTTGTNTGYTVNGLGGDQVDIVINMADPVFYPIRITGVKTASVGPVFGSAVTIDQPSVSISK